MNRTFLAVLVSALAWGQSEWPRPRLILAARGLETPVDIQSPRDGTRRLFIVEQRGRIRIIRNGVLAVEPFLDIRSKVSFGGERGLLGLAFPPDFARKQYFYVNYTEGFGASIGDLRTVISRFRVSSASPDVAVASSEERILVFQQPFDNHNGGQLAFGPRDGMLYIGTGDGGSGGDPQNNAQTGSTLLGKMLRIDVESGAAPYAVPANNPFRGNPAYRPEVWATGLRNPWRYSFDRQTGDLWIADVGQNAREEVDFQPGTSTGGENYGWRFMEASFCYNPPTGCPTTGLVLPVFEYGRNLGASITGGPLYRGKWLPAWTGVNLTGDYVSGRVWGIRREGSTFASRELINAGFLISSFGVDEDGEAFIADHGRGDIHRLVDMRPSLRPDGVTNAASFQPGLVAGSLVTLFGAGVSSGAPLDKAAAIPLPFELGGTTVQIDGAAVPLFAVANVGGTEQVNLQVPWELASRPEVTIAVSRGAERSVAITVPVSPASPGVFTSDGARAIAAFNNSGQLVTPAQPAQAGDFVVLYATGLGAVDNQPVTGRATPRSPLARVRDTVGVTIGGRTARVLFAGLAPDMIGVYQLNVEMPAGAGQGDVDVIVTVSGHTSPAVKLAVR